MDLHARFSFEPEWRHAPLAWWVHVPIAPGGTAYAPPAPGAVPHRGYPILNVSVGRHTLRFSSAAQLDHFLDVLARSPLPTSRQLSRRRAASAGPNGHWLSRLPAALKSPRMRAGLVKALRRVREQVVAPATAAGHAASFRLDVLGQR